MFKPKYIVILTGLFCSVVAGVLRTFTRFFSVNVLARVDFFGMTTMAFGLGKPSPPITFPNYREILALT